MPPAAVILSASQTVLSVVQSLSHVQLLATPWTAARQPSLSITNSWNLLKLTSIDSVMLYSHLILCCPLLLLPSIFPSIRVFSNESVLHIRWPKYWSFGFSLSAFNEYSVLISFRIDWFDLSAVQWTLKRILQARTLEWVAISFSNMTNLDSVLKSRDITLLTKVHLVKAMVFPVLIYRCESRAIKKAECQRIDAFELWC